jgi:leucine-rich repeat protein SHOC2
MGYLQVICGQHRLVEQHLDKFVSPTEDVGMDAKRPKPLTSRDEVPTDPGALAQLISAHLAAAASSGVIDLRFLGTPEAAARLPELKNAYVIDVRNNGWAELPAAVAALPQLVVLNASSNHLEKVACAAPPEHLGVLNLSFNRLSELPAELGKAPVLQQMYLANNRLSDLPASFSQLPMVDLFLSENLFQTIPQAVLGMKQLSKLSIACCQLKEVPPELSAVASLRFLDLSFNKVGDGRHGTSRGWSEYMPMRLG